MKSLPIFLNLVIIEMIVIAVLLTKLNKEYGKELLTNDIVPPYHPGGGTGFC